MPHINHSTASLRPPHPPLTLATSPTRGEVKKARLRALTIRCPLPHMGEDGA
jgi:hypothetical protein